MFLAKSRLNGLGKHRARSITAVPATLRYGTGADPDLAHNRIFARWLQKRVVLVTREGKRRTPTQACGPDRQLLSTDGASNLFGHLEFYRVMP